MDVYQCLGMVLVLASLSPLYTRLRVESFLRSVLLPFRIGQFRIYTDRSGRPIGAFTWAYLTPEAEARFLANEPLRRADWSGGDRLYVVDAVARPGFGPSMFREMSETVFPDAPVVHAKRELRPGLVRKISYRRGKVPTLRG